LKDEKKGPFLRTRDKWLEEKKLWEEEIDVARGFSIAIEYIVITQDFFKEKGLPDELHNEYIRYLADNFPIRPKPQEKK